MPLDKKEKRKKKSPGILQIPTFQVANKPERPVTPEPERQEDGKFEVSLDLCNETLYQKKRAGEGDIKEGDREGGREGRQGEK